MMLFISKARAFFKKLFYYLCLVYFSCFLPCVKVTRIQNLKKIKFQSCQASRGTPHHLPTDSWTCLVLVLAVMIIFKTPVTFTYRSRAERPPQPGQKSNKQQSTEQQTRGVCQQFPWPSYLSWFVFQPPSCDCTAFVRHHFGLGDWSHWTHTVRHTKAPFYCFCNDRLWRIPKDTLSYYHCCSFH